MRKLLTFFFLLLLLSATDLCLAQQRPAIKWQKCLGGSKDDKANDILLNNDGTMVVVGSSKSNDGNVSGHHGSLDSTDAWVAKLDAEGTVIWQKSIGGVNNDQFNSVIATGDGGYLCIGFTNSTDGDVVFNNGSSDFFIVKLNGSGTMVWEQTFGGTRSDIASSGTLTSDGGFAIIGTSRSFDGDVQSGIFNRTISDAWVIRLTASGDLLWEKCLEYGTKDNKGYNIFEAADQNLIAYSSGSTYYEYVYDTEIYRVYKTPGILYSLDNTTGSSTFKLNTGGDINYAMSKAAGKYNFSFEDFSNRPPPFNCSDTRYITGSVPYDLSAASSSQVGFIDCFNFSPFYDPVYNFAPIHGVAGLPNGSAVTTGYVETNGANTKSGLVIFSAGRYYSYGVDYSTTAFNSIKVFSSGDEYITAGYTDANSGDIAGNHGGYDCWVVRLVNSNKITGNVFVDRNGNGIKDAGELSFDNVKVKSEKYGVAQYATPQNGYYENYTDSGTFRTTLEINKPYYTTANTSEISVFAGYGNLDTINFPVTPLPAIKDYAVAVSPLNPPKTAQTQEYVLTYFNRGTDTILNKQVIFIKDHRSTFGYATPVISGISGDTLIWNISNIFPDSVGSIKFYLNLDPIPQLNVGDTLVSAAYIDSIGDAASSDNLVTLRQLVKGSYDPNDKQEAHGGFITPGEMAAEKYLTYTIRFQNTGNEAATNIILRDTLQSKLDGSSIEMVSSSHAFSFNLYNGKYAVWTFNNINLPDSFTNEPLSNGYVTYRVRPVPGFVTGDTIRNTASIYFDFNPPVITNTQLTVFTAVKCIWTGAANTAWENPLNWSNGKVPDKGTDVYINGGTVNSPEINSEAFCRIIRVSTNAALKIKTGNNLTVGGEYLP